MNKTVYAYNYANYFPRFDVISSLGIPREINNDAKSYAGNQLKT